MICWNIILYLNTLRLYTLFNYKSICELDLQTIYKIYCLLDKTIYFIYCFNLNMNVILCTKQYINMQ